MIWFTVNNAIASVDLFQKDHPHQLVRECHFGKAESIVGSFKHFLSKSYGTSDHKLDMAVSPDSQIVDLFCKFLRSELFSCNLQGNHKRIILNIFQKTFTLFVPDGILHCLTGIVRCFLIGCLYDLQLAVTAEPLGLLCDRIS